VAATVNIRAVRYLLLGWAKDVPLTDINHFRTGNKADVRFPLGGLLGISWAQVLGEPMTSVLEERALVTLNQQAVSSAFVHQALLLRPIRSNLSGKWACFDAVVRIGHFSHHVTSMWAACVQNRNNPWHARQHGEGFD
jgi:hypothetical protein